jgi:hypothetical protein
MSKVPAEWRQVGDDEWKLKLGGKKDGKSFEPLYPTRCPECGKHLLLTFHGAITQTFALTADGSRGNHLRNRDDIDIYWETFYLECNSDECGFTFGANGGKGWLKNSE